MVSSTSLSQRSRWQWLLSIIDARVSPLYWNTHTSDDRQRQAEWLAAAVDAIPCRFKDRQMRESLYGAALQHGARMCDAYVTHVSAWAVRLIIVRFRTKILPTVSIRVCIFAVQIVGVDTPRIVVW